jgi:hypothetical protein
MNEWNDFKKIKKNGKGRCGLERADTKRVGGRVWHAAIKPAADGANAQECCHPGSACVALRGCDISMDDRRSVRSTESAGADVQCSLLFPRIRSKAPLFLHDEEAAGVVQDGGKACPIRVQGSVVATATTAWGAVLALVKRMILIRYQS